MSNRVPFGKNGLEYFIDYEDVKKVKVLCVMLPNMSAYRRYFEGTKYMSFLIKNDGLLQKYNEF